MTSAWRTWSRRNSWRNGTTASAEWMVDGGDLGQQRLEDEIVVGVDELDLELAAALPLERLGGEHAAEAAADHENLLLFHGQPSLLLAIPTWLGHTYANAALRQVTRMQQGKA